MFKIILQLHAHKKGTGSSHNGRDSNSQRLGTKAHDRSEERRVGKECGRT